MATVACVALFGGDNEAAGFSRFALLVAVLFVLFITITCINIREKSTVNVEAPTVGEMFRSLLKNDQAVTVGNCDCTD